jgi:energy-coupling factor transport system ATP-binding protein
VTNPDPVVSIRDLSFRYPPTISGRKVTALRTISLTIGPGEFVLITGPSGSGKSTLARCLNGLIPHATTGTMEGSVIVCGMDTRDHDVPEFAMHVGMVFQDPGCQLVTGDVESEIAFGLEIRNLPEGEICERIGRAADLLHIGHLMERLITDLSWGERQRIAIASVIAVRPSILVMDEPFSGIDASAAQNLVKLLAGIRKELGTTIIIFEHRAASLLPVIDRRVMMNDGTITSDSKPDPSVLHPDRKNTLPGENFSMVGAMSSLQENSPLSIPVPLDGRAPVPSISVRDISYRYPGSGTPALDRITIDFWPGEITVITGANGSGKTTLLKHCNGLLLPERGSIFLGTEPLAGKTVAGAARTVGLLNQHADYQIFESTITEELAFGPRNLGRSEREIQDVISEIRKRCSLSPIDPATPPLGLSGGEKQRVAIAGILAMDTPVIILDEPTFGLDPELKTAFTGVIRELRDAGKTVIIATHDEEFGMACGDRFIRISAGRIESDERRAHGSFPSGDPEKREPGPQGESSHVS